MQLLVDEPDYPYRKQVEDDIDHTRKIIGIVERLLGNYGRSYGCAAASGGKRNSWQTPLHM